MSAIKIFKIIKFHFCFLESNAYVTTAISVASLITENLLSHPFIVLRRQCQVFFFNLSYFWAVYFVTLSLNIFLYENDQVHNSLRNYHIVPYTLLPVVVRLHKRQDFTTLWKGIGSTCIVKGLNLAVEDVLSKGTGWPKFVLYTIKKYQIYIINASIILFYNFFQGNWKMQFSFTIFTTFNFEMVKFIYNIPYTFDAILY